MKKAMYVVGFLFSPDGAYVALIKKENPAWQKGKLNGIGGKIEENESALQAMEREFKEEAGVSISNWTPFCILMGNDASYVEGGREFEVHFFSHFSDLVHTVKTMTGERVEVIHLPTYPVATMQNAVPNLQWLIPLALQRGLIAKVYEGI